METPNTSTTKPSLNSNEEAANTATTKTSLTGHAATIGKLDKGHTSSVYRLKGGKVVDLNTIGKEEAIALAEDPSFKVFVKK